MLFVFDYIHVNLHDDREQYRTATKLLVQTYVNKETNSLCVGNATREKVCVSKSTLPMYSHHYTVYMLQACTTSAMPAAGVIDRRHSAQGHMPLIHWSLECAKSVTGTPYGSMATDNIQLLQRPCPQLLLAEGNGDLQTLICVLVARPRRCLTLSNPVP